VGLAACCSCSFFDLRTDFIQRKTPRARRSKNPTAAPTPMPAFAPVLSPVEELLDDADDNDVAAAAAEVVCAEDAEKEMLLAAPRAVEEVEEMEEVEEDEEVEVEEVDDELEDVSFDLMMNALLES